MRRAAETEVPVPPTATACQGDRTKWAVMKIPDLSEADALQPVCQNSVIFWDSQDTGPNFLALGSTVNVLMVGFGRNSDSEAVKTRLSRSPSVGSAF